MAHRPPASRVDSPVARAAGFEPTVPPVTIQNDGIACD